MSMSKLLSEAIFRSAWLRQSSRGDLAVEQMVKTLNFFPLTRRLLQIKTNRLLTAIRFWEETHVHACQGCCFRGL
jgi:hypothetical protein